MLRTVTMLLVLSCTAACKNEEKQTQLDELAHKVTADSQTDAAAAIVDEDLRFRLEWPGQGWKMLGREEARRLVPAAFAGALRSPDVFAAVIVERVPGMSADELTDLTLSAVGLRDLEIEQRAPFRIAGVDGVRVVFRGRLDGNLFHYANIVFTHADHGYQLLGWGVGDFDVAVLDPLWRGFSLQGGEVRMPAAKAITDARGPGWRIVGGVFESAVSGLRVEPRGEWTLVIGQELAAMNPEAEIGLSSRDGTYLVVVPERVGPVAPEAYRVAKLATFEQTAGALQRDAWQADVLGASSGFAAAHNQGMELLLTTQVVNEIGLQVLGYYPERMRDAGRVELKDALAGFDLLAPEARDALRYELAAAPDTKHEVGSDYSIHRGVFRDFANHLVWTRVPGLWKLTGPRTDPQLRLLLEDLERSVRGELRVQPTTATDAEAWYRERLAQLGSTNTTPKPMSVAGLELLVGELPLDAGGIPLEAVVATALHEGRGLSLSLIGPPGSLTKNASWVAEVQRALAIDPELSAVRVSDGQYVDQRLGLAIDLPKGFTHESIPVGGASATGYLFKQGDRAVHVAAIGHGGALVDASFAGEFAERAMRSIVTEDLGAAEDRSRKVGDYDLRWHHWSPPFKPRVDSVVTTVPDGTLILVMLGLGDAEVDAVVTSMRSL
jgi:hypothetical protein